MIQRHIEDYEHRANVLILYHANCIDGFTSAWVCNLGLIAGGILSTNIQVKEIQYGELTVGSIDFDVYNSIYIVDFSASIYFLKSAEGKVNLVIIDHHKTAMEMYLPYVNNSSLKSIEDFNKYKASYVYKARLNLDLEECGASLVWHYFFNDKELPKLIQYVKDYDLWRFSLANTKYINKYLCVIPKTFEAWDKVYRDLNSSIGYNDIVDQGKLLQQQHDTTVEALLKNATPCILADTLGLAVNCSPEYASSVGNALAKDSKTFGATWYVTANCAVKWSLRSSNYVDVALLAAELGGGGHKNAAGFNSTIDQLEEHIWPA